MGGVRSLCSLLLIILLEKAASQSCPAKCKFCSIKLAECEEVFSLKSVLSGLPILTEQILLRNGNLSTIAPGSFQNFSRLQLLSITGFMVSSLANMTFAPAPESAGSALKSLDLSRNQFFSCGVAASAFSGLDKLEQLLLSSNAFHTLSKSWWSGMRSLKKLVLSANKITYLPPRTFESLTQLHELTVPDNSIQYLITDTFYGLVSLTELDLSKNEIFFISEDAFQPLRELKYLKLFQNKLVTLPSISDSLTSLWLAGNPWNCSCKLVRTLQSLAGRVEEPTELLCESPEKVKEQQVLKVEPEVCASTPREEDSPPQSPVGFFLAYGFLGGFLFTFVIWLVVCFVTKHWKSKRKSIGPTTHGEDQQCNLKTGVSLGEKPVHIPLAMQHTIKRETGKTETAALQTGHEANSTEKPRTELFCQTLKDIEDQPRAVSSKAPLRAAADEWDTIDNLSKGPKESRPPDQNVFVSPLFKGLDEDVEKTRGIAKWSSAPDLLPRLDDPERLPPTDLLLIAEVSGRERLPGASGTADIQDLRDFPDEALSPKCGVGFLVTSFSDDKAMHPMKMTDTESGLKYFETQHEEKCMESSECFVSPPPSNTLEAAINHPESIKQINANNREVGQRSKTWSTFYGISSDPTGKPGDGRYDKNEMCVRELAVGSTSSKREQPFRGNRYEENFQGEEQIDVSDEESISEKELVRFFCSEENVSSYSSESCDEQDLEDLEDDVDDVNLTPAPSSPATLAKLQKQRGTANVSVPVHKGSKMSTYETKLASPYLRPEKMQQKTVCDADKLGKERCRHKQRSKKGKQGFSLSSDRLTKERFWKYHKNCCDEYKPCATAKKVLKYIKNIPPQQLDKESTQSPPSDLDLLEDQTTVLPLPAINGKDAGSKLQRKVFQNENCIRFPNLAMYLTPRVLPNTRKQLREKSIPYGTPKFIKIKSVPQVDLPSEKLSSEPEVENQFGSVNFPVGKQRDLAEGSVARQIINVCNVLSELPSAIGNKRTSLCTTSDYKPRKPNSDVLSAQIVCAGANPTDSGKGRTMNIPDSPIKTCLQLSKVAFSKTAVNADETSLACGYSKSILQNVREAPECVKLVHQGVCVDAIRLPPRDHWVDDMDCGNELPGVLGSGKHASMLSYHSDKLLTMENREDCYQSQNNSGIVQLNETGQNISDMLMANESRPRKHSGKMLHDNQIENNFVLTSMNCSSNVCKPTAHGSYEESINHPDEHENCRSARAALSRTASVSVLEQQNDGKCGNSKHRECLIDSKDQFYLSEANTDGSRCLGHVKIFGELEVDAKSEETFILEQNCTSLSQKDRPVITYKELKQSLNDCLAQKLSRRIYDSVFKLPVGSTSWEESYQNEDSKILTPGVKQMPFVPESGKYKMKIFPPPNILKREPESTLDLNSKSEELVMESVAKMAYISSLYKTKPPQKLISNAFQKSDEALLEVNDLSVLSNLHFCKIAEVTVNLKKREGTEQLQDDEDCNAPPEPIASSSNEHSRSLSRQELSADNELSLMSMLCSLKKSLEHSCVLQKSNKLDP